MAGGCTFGGLVGLLALLVAVRSAGIGVPVWLYLLFAVAVLLQLAAIGNRPTR